ncbi:MAG: permease-like cell division protein FtsX [Bacteroidaceae bacterium]|nr:permease-like cell division protein FtsX [Bacteroidaceae bacterium]
MGTSHTSKKRKKGGIQGGTIASGISITLVLVLLGLVVLFGLTAMQLSRNVRENLTVTLLLDDDLDSLQTDGFKNMLSQQPYVSRLTLITKEQALREEIQVMGNDPSEFLGGENPYTASIELNLESEYANTDSLVNITRELKKRWEVSDVIYQRDLVERLNSNLQKATIVLIVLAALLLIISIVLINNTVRLNVYARRFQIHTMRLVGASWSFIEWPFLRHSLAIGITSATIADLLLAGGVWYAIKQDPAIADVVTQTTIIIMLATVIAFGLLLTSVCTTMSVAHFLRMREDEMYK